jgi:hypothetical protein
LSFQLLSRAITPRLLSRGGKFGERLDSVTGASAKATKMPNGRLAIVAVTAIFNDSQIAVHSAGDSTAKYQLLRHGFLGNVSVNFRPEAVIGGWS